MSREDDLKKLINHHQRRLQIRKEQQAVKGINVDPEILIEIEDVEATIEKLQTELNKLTGISETTYQAEHSTQSPIQETISKTSFMGSKTGEPQVMREQQQQSSTPPVDFVIITTLEEERDAVLDKLPGCRRLKPSKEDIRVYFSANIPVHFPDGSTGNYRVIVMPLLNMGRVQAAIATADAIHQWSPRYVIIVGIAGGVAKEGVNLGDILISDQIVDYELQKLTTQGAQIRWQAHQVDPSLLGAARNFTSKDWQKLMAIKRPKWGEPIRHIGPILSGDKIIAVDTVVAKYRRTWPKVVGVEMEGAGVALASFQAAKQTRFFMVRGVSDLANEDKGQDRVEDWRKYACDVAASYTIRLLQRGPVSPSSFDERSPSNESAPIQLEQKPPEDNLELEPPYGIMRPGSKFYIERVADQECQMSLSQDEAATLFIQAPRQMGKSSLMYRTIDWTRKEYDKAFAFIDFQNFPEQYLQNEDDFFKEFCWMISDALGISEELDQYWQGRRSNIIKCSNYLSKHLISKLERPLILAMDEVERLLSSPFRSDFFGMLRTWHNRRAFDENFDRVTLFLSGSTEPYLLIDNPHQSPFNVAKTVFLQDFTGEEMSKLNELHSSPLSQQEVNQLMELIGGHPYLTRLAFYLLATSKIDFETLLAQATEDTGPFGDHLHRFYVHLLQQPKLKRALTRIVIDQQFRPGHTVYRLMQGGLVKRVGPQVVMRNRLYARYFGERLNV